MLRKVFVMIPLLFLGLSGFSQNDISSYKYVIVPKTFDFLKSEDQFQLNSLSKFMFDKYGFVALFDDEPLPEDLIKNGCLALNADVIKESGMFNTKLFIELKNCRKQVVFQSQVGDSDHKKSEVAYKMALREAFKSFESLNYKYEEIASNVTIVEEPKPVKPAVKEAVAVPTSEKVMLNENTSEVLYAQKINNGYQLVDSTPKVVYTLIYTGKEDFYMVKGRDATIYKQDNQWVIAETVGDDLQVKTLNIKF